MDNFKQKDRSLLVQGLEFQKIALNEETIDKLINYLEILEEWNQIHNLTGIKDHSERVSKHLLDSLSILDILSGPKILDVGTGAGLPGIPLALAKPEYSFVLLDSNQKKINFVQYAVMCLGIKNVQVICSRVQNYKPELLFDCVISRAYSSLHDFIDTAGHCLRQHGSLLAMKGDKESVLLQNLPIGYTVGDILDLKVAGLNEKRCVVVIKKE